MKLNNTANEVLTNSQNESKFTINASATAFKILSDGLYEHKVAAIVRELSCNAYDAHVEFGNQDVPFKVILPNDLHPYFEIEDFGVGLDDNGVREVYTSYFTSTKSDSNDAIGAFGLGSKTPFAYTTSFNIRARKDGVERLYTAYIGDDGAPCVNMLTSKNTTEHNGVKITVPVKPHHYSSFSNEASFVLSFFSVKPIVTDPHFSYAAPDSVIHDLNEKGIAICNKINCGSQLYNSRVYAVMGGVCYRLGEHLIRYSVKDRYLNDVVLTYGMGGSTLFIKFDIGELEVAASRETLSMDENTHKLIVSRTEDLVPVLKKDVQEKIEKHSSFYEAIMYIDNLYRLGPMGRQLFSYEGKLLYDWSKKTILKGFTVAFDSSARWHKTKKISYSHSYGISVDKLLDNNENKRSPVYAIYTDNENDDKLSGLQKYTRQLTPKSNGICLVFKGPVSKLRQQRLENLLDIEISWHRLEDLKEEEKQRKKAEKALLGPKPKSNTPSVKLDENIIRAISYKNDKRYSSSRIDLNDGNTYYKGLNYHSIDNSFIPCKGAKPFGGFAEAHVKFLSEFLDKDFTVILENKMNEKKIQKADIPCISELFSMLYQGDNLTDLAKLEALDGMGRWNSDREQKELKDFICKISYTNIESTIPFDLVKMAENNINFKSFTDFETIEKYSKLTQNEFDKLVQEQKKIIIDEAEKLKETYPVLKFALGRGFNHREEIDLYNDYIKMVDFYLESQ